MNKIAGILAIVLIAAGAAAFWFERQANKRLRAEVAQLRQAATELEAKIPPPRDPLLIDINAAELAKLRADQSAYASLREEHAALEKRVEGLAQAATERAKAAQTRPNQPPISGELRPAATWRNAGMATPLAAYETAIWAASQGEIDVFASTIGFQQEGRARLEAVFASLPDAIKAEMGSPEKVFATMLAARLPTDVVNFGLVSETPKGPDETTVRVRMQRENGQTKDDSIPMVRQPDGTWRLLVPDRMVDGYARSLSAKQ